MVLIASRLGHGIDNGAPAASKLGRKGVRLNLEFLDRVDARAEHYASVIIGVVIYTIQEEVVEGSARSVCGETVLATCARTTRVAICADARRHDTRAQRSELQVIAAIQREICHGLRCDHLTQA